jgi:hypothetical protein
LGAAVAVIFLSQGKGAPSVGPAAPSLVGASFTTRYPSGWTITLIRPVPGVAVYELGSSSGKLNDVNIPALGEIGITVTEFPLDKFAAKADPAAPAQSPLALLPHVIGIPRVAQSPQFLSPPHMASLGGYPAAAEKYSYNYNGIGNVQSDVVARVGATIVSVEMDAEPSLALRAEAAMSNLLQHWHWRGAQAVRSSSTSPGAAAASVRHPADIAGYYEAVGTVLSSEGVSGERAGTRLLRDWSIRRSCRAGGCGLLLTRDVAGVSGDTPISALLHPTRTGWTAHFVQTGRCTSPGATSRSTEYSTWQISRTGTAVEAIEHGYAPRSPACAGYSVVFHWYAKRLSGGA